MKIAKITFFTLLLITIFSCSKDDYRDNNVNSFSANFGNEISKTFIGTVVDINNVPIIGAEIRVGTETAMTDVNGVFIVKNAQVYKRFAYIKAKKVGYINGSRSVVPNTAISKVTIMLLKENVVATVNSGQISTVSLPNGASVTLNGEYITQDGNVYSGAVNVILHHLDPSNSDMQYQMPGMLYAENINGEERLLQTYGMLAVKLKGSAGEELNISSSSTAEIRMPLGASLIATAPQSIPLWYFDEETGYWKEEGRATLIGNEYVGQVSHFSFWNYDAPFPVVNLCLTLLDQNNNPLAGQFVTLTHSNSSYPYPVASGYTNSDGEVCGLIPSNEELVLKGHTRNNICGAGTLFTMNIGPYSTDVSETITINITTSNVISESITGVFNTCNNTPVNNGYIILTYEGNQIISYVTNGNFDINLMHCATPTNFTIQGIDVDNSEATSTLNYSFNTPTNVGVISSCNSLNEYITYTIDNQNPIILFTSLGYDHGPPALYFSAFFGSANSYISFDLTLPNDIAGMYTVADGASLDITDMINYNFLCANNNPNYCVGVPPSPDFNVELIQYGNVGDFIDVSFSGPVYDVEFDIYKTITGTIHIIRTF